MNVNVRMATYLDITRRNRIFSSITKYRLWYILVNDFDTNLEFKVLYRDLAHDRRIVDYKSEK